MVVSRVAMLVFVSVCGYPSIVSSRFVCLPKSSLAMRASYRVLIVPSASVIPSSIELLQLHGHVCFFDPGSDGAGKELGVLQVPGMDGMSYNKHARFQALAFPFLA